MSDYLNKTAEEWAETRHKLDVASQSPFAAALEDIASLIGVTPKALADNTGKAA